MNSRVQNVSATGSSESHRVRTTLTVTVTRVVFSPSAAPSSAESAANGPVEPSASLQVTGRVAVENQYVKLGAFHTLDIEANRDVRIEKLEWDSISLERVQEASVPGRGAEVGAIVCGEGMSAVHSFRSRAHYAYFFRDRGLLPAVATHDCRSTTYRCPNTSQTRWIGDRTREGSCKVLRSYVPDLPPPHPILKSKLARDCHREPWMGSRRRLRLHHGGGHEDEQQSTLNGTAKIHTCSCEQPARA
jgi:hypothetical protein